MMTNEIKTDELLTFFKALSDANRLKIVGLLSQQELSVEQIAEMLGVSPSTISHHLAKLTRVGLVSARAESYYNIYRLGTKNAGGDVQTTAGERNAAGNSSRD